MKIIFGPHPIIPEMEKALYKGASIIRGPHILSKYEIMMDGEIYRCNTLKKVKEIIDKEN